jgi:hypothetical protein
MWRYAQGQALSLVEGFSMTIQNPVKSIMSGFFLPKHAGGKSQP